VPPARILHNLEPKAISLNCRNDANGHTDRQGREKSPTQLKRPVSEYIKKRDKPEHEPATEPDATAVTCWRIGLNRDWIIEHDRAFCRLTAGGSAARAAKPTESAAAAG
jgi:hypothetical protein